MIAMVKAGDAGRVHVCQTDIRQFWKTLNYAIVLLGFLGRMMIMESAFILTVTGHSVKLKSDCFSSFC